MWVAHLAPVTHMKADWVNHPQVAHPLFNERWNVFKRFDLKLLFLKMFFKDKTWCETSAQVSDVTVCIWLAVHGWYVSRVEPNIMHHLWSTDQLPVNLNDCDHEAD